MSKRALANVIRHARIGARNAIEDVIERNFGAIRVTVLAGFNQPLGVGEVAL